MEDYLAKSLEEWKEDISEVLSQINEEYDQIKLELKLYSYKYGITKQVIQSTVNDEIIESIRERYHRPFEEKYNDLKEHAKDLEEKEKYFKCSLTRLMRLSVRNLLAQLTWRPINKFL